MFENAEIISRYTREQALEDGTLIDVSTVAREAGIKFHTAVSQAVWATCVEVPRGVECQDESGRLWDVVWMLRHAIRTQPDGELLLYKLHVRNTNRRGTPPLVTLKAVCGGDDNGAPCITVMLPEED